MKAVIKILSLINDNISSSNQSRFHKSYGSWRFSKEQRKSLPRVERMPPF